LAEPPKKKVPGKEKTFVFSLEKREGGGIRSESKEFWSSRHQKEKKEKKNKHKKKKKKKCSPNPPGVGERDKWGLPYTGRLT